MVCKCHTVTFRPEICVKMSIFKVDIQSDHIETKCSWVKVSQGKNVTVDVSSGSICHSGRNVGGHNVKASCLMDCEYDSPETGSTVYVSTNLKSIGGGLTC
jgi:hypothetical protein